jgi:NACHT domain
LLWIKGGPGKGETMLLIGVINELSQQLEPALNSGLLSYFFCQGADSSLNNATVVLRGLIYLLLVQQTSLISHLRKEYDGAGRILFDNREGCDAFFVLSKIFKACYMAHVLKGFQGST